MQTERLSICYVLPGRDLRPGSSHSRQVLALARALARDARVTVVFRHLLEDVRGEPFVVTGLEAGSPTGGDVAPSRRALGRFVEQHASTFGVIIEGSWPMSGKLTAWCAQRGVPAIPIVDRLPRNSWLAPIDASRTWLALGASGRYLRRVPVMVAASEELRSAIVDRWRVAPDRIAVIGPAIDRTLFAPRDQGEARRRLGLSPDHRILLVGDGLGPGGHLGPLIEAVQRAGDPALRLHVVGDGERRAELEQLAGHGEGVTLHQPRSDDDLATCIAAADLCVSLADGGDPPFTPLECLSAGRPVAVARAGDRSPHPVCHLVSGFVVEHDPLAWIRFLQRDCPSRNTLRMMGMAAAVTPIPHLDRTAAAYLQAIDRARSGHVRPAAAG